MVCPAIITGDQFVTRVLTHIDCQAQYLGSYGYQSLAQSGSVASLLISGLLTLFVALWGLRLLFGPTPTARDLIYDILKVGIVLTLAFSWPAFRTLVYDVTIHGPGEIAASLSSPGIAPIGAGFVESIQQVDNAIVALTEIGTGRQTGAFIDQESVGGTFAGSALEDESAFGWSRLIFLSGLMGSLVLVRILAGLLLSIAPLAAGLLLFRETRSLFTGWLRGIIMALLGSLGISIVIAIELAVLSPWLADALRARNLGYAIPAAPIELFAMTLAFALVQLAIIWAMGKIAFMQAWLPRAERVERPTQYSDRNGTVTQYEARHYSMNRVDRIADHVRTRMRLEERPQLAYAAKSPEQPQGRQGPSTLSGSVSRANSTAGSRALRSPSRSSSRRDGIR